MICFGSGYLASHLARHFPLTLTTRNVEKKKLGGAHFVLFSFEDTALLKSLLQHFDTVFLTIAPSVTSSYEETYLQSAYALKKTLPSNVKQLVYTSSTSVYAEKTGAIVTEASPLDIDDPYARVLIETEQVLQSLPTHTTIFRLSEIYGPNRSLQQKVASYRGLQAPGTGQNFANMIHVEDIARAFAFALKEDLDGIYNLSDQDPISRKTLYDHVAEQYELPAVHWDSTKITRHGKNKIVNSDKLLNRGFTFLYPHRQI